MRCRALGFAFAGAAVAMAAAAQQPSDSVRWVAADRVEIKSTVIASDGCYSTGTRDGRPSRRVDGSPKRRLVDLPTEAHQRHVHAGARSRSQSPPRSPAMPKPSWCTRSTRGRNRRRSGRGHSRQGERGRRTSPKLLIGAGNEKSNRFQPGIGVLSSAAPGRHDGRTVPPAEASRFKLDVPPGLVRHSLSNGGFGSANSLT